MRGRRRGGRDRPRAAERGGIRLRRDFNDASARTWHRRRARCPPATPPRGSRGTTSRSADRPAGLRTRRGEGPHGWPSAAGEPRRRVAAPRAAASRWRRARRAAASRSARRPRPVGTTRGRPPSRSSASHRSSCAVDARAASRRGRRAARRRGRGRRSQTPPASARRRRHRRGRPRRRAERALLVRARTTRRRARTIPARPLFFFGRLQATLVAPSRMADGGEQRHLAISAPVPGRRPPSARRRPALAAVSRTRRRNISVPSPPGWSSTRGGVNGVGDAEPVGGASRRDLRTGLRAERVPRSASSVTHAATSWSMTRASPLGRAARGGNRRGRRSGAARSRSPTRARVFETLHSRRREARKRMRALSVVAHFFGISFARA